MTTEITKERLIEFGMSISNDPTTYMEKTIGESDQGKLQIVLTGIYNTQNFALFLPDGGMLFINPTCMEHLRIFEGMIHSYEPNF